MDDILTATQVSIQAAKRIAARRQGYEVGYADAEAEIADWLEGQAGEIEAGVRRNLLLDYRLERVAAYRQAAEAVRQGRARREGA